MFERYNVDVLGVSEAGLPPEGRSYLRETMSKRLKEVGLCCVWGHGDQERKGVGVMILWRKGLCVIEAPWVGTGGGRMVGVELTTWNEALSEGEKCLFIVLYGYTGMTTQEKMSDEAVAFNQAVGKAVKTGLDKYHGRVMCMGDLNSLGDVCLDGMGLVGGVVSEGSLVSVLQDSGLVDCFRELHPNLKAVSCSTSAGSYSRIDYMFVGWMVQCVRSAYLMNVEGPWSDHMLMLGDLVGFATGAIYGIDDAVNIRDLVDWEVVRAVPVPFTGLTMR